MSSLEELAAARLKEDRRENYREFVKRLNEKMERDRKGIDIQTLLIKASRNISDRKD